MEHTLGKHILLDLRDCSAKVLDDVAYLKSVLLSVAERTGAPVIGESFHRFDPQGVSGILLISGSHLCIHTWPEYGYAAIDIFTHGENFDPEDAARLIVEKFHSKAPSIVELKRGF